MFRQWNTIKTKSILKAKKVQLSVETPSMLAGTKLILSYREVWPQGALTALRCILSEDQYNPSSNNQITRFVKHIYPVSLPRVGTVKHIAQPISTISEILVEMIKKNFTANGYKIYTDGGWNNQTNTIYELLYGKDTTKYQATRAICLVKEDELT